VPAVESPWTVSGHFLTPFSDAFTGALIDNGISRRTVCLKTSPVSGQFLIHLGLKQGDRPFYNTRIADF
jgi:hypothetical protein